MASRKISTPLPPAPYVKSPFQLEQWAAYEALKAQHDAEFAEKAELFRVEAAASHTLSALGGAVHKWQHAESIRAYVTATMALVPQDASQLAVDAATKWQIWALGVADDCDSASTQVNKFLSAAK